MWKLNFIGLALAITKKLHDQQKWWFAVVITLFCPSSNALRNHHIDFSSSCSYKTKLSSPVLLAYQLPIKNGVCYVQETIYSKKPQQLSISLSDVPLSENAWNSNFFRLYKIYVYMYVYIYIIWLRDLRKNAMW